MVTKWYPFYLYFLTISCIVKPKWAKGFPLVHMILDPIGSSNTIHSKLIFICNEDVTNINYPFPTFNKYIITIINKVPIIWNMLWVHKHGCQPFMSRSIPCPQYSMISSWVTLVHVRIIMIWCLFPCNAHLHVQHAYWENGYFAWYMMALARCWFRTTWAPSLSRIGWATWVHSIS